MPTQSYEEMSTSSNLSEEMTFLSNETLDYFNRSLECGRRLHSENYRFWLDGISVAVVGSFGFIGNLLALIVLSRPHLRDVFHTLLFALACFDLLFIVFGGINYTFRAFNVSTDAYTYLYPYVVYPLSHIAVAGTIFMTMAISIERYLGLCHPLSPVHRRKAWMYILPVVFISVILNAPKFFEIKVRHEYDNATGLDVPAISSTELRHEKTYVLGYIMWTRLITTGVIPVMALIYLNSRIVYDLMKSTKVQRFGSARCNNKERNLSFVLLCIVLIFFCCHASRIYLDVYEFFNVDLIMQCRPLPWWPSDVMQILVFLSHLLMIINSSMNFAVYCLVGHTFRREMCRTFGLKDYARVPGGLSRRSSKNEFSMVAPSTTYRIAQATNQSSVNQSSFVSTTNASRGVAGSGNSVSFKAKIDKTNGTDDQGSNSLSLHKKEIAEEPFIMADNVANLSNPDTGAVQVKTVVALVAPKSFIEIEARCTPDDLKDILMPEVNSEPRVTTRLLEKFNENKSPILV